VKYKQLLGNSLVAFFAQGVGTLAGLVTALIVPKVLGIVGFGYWQLFIFYTSYIGFFHLGLNDGAYLKSGGVSRAQIDKRLSNSVFWVGMAYQSAFVLVASVIVWTSSADSDRKLVLFSSAAVLILLNSAAYLGFIFQAMNETKLYSYSIIVDRFIFAALVIVGVAMRVSDFRFYIGAFIVGKLLSLMYCVVKGWDFFRSGLVPFLEASREALDDIRVGSKLMFANIASMLILGVVRFAIDGHWGIVVFGKVSFALSLAMFIMQFVMQVSMVLFPALRQSSAQERRRVYRTMSEILDLLMPFVFVLYFPMVMVLDRWLPQYHQSFFYFALLLPICIFDGKMDVTCTTFFKVLRNERLLLVINLAMLLLSAVLTWVQVSLFDSLIGVLLSVVGVLILRSIVSEMILNREMGLSFPITIVAPIMLSVLFVLSVVLLPSLWALVVNSLAYGIGLIVFRGRLQGIAEKINAMKTHG
jgi:O-antigen/teichoic acid export membrane protein